MINLPILLICLLNFLPPALAQRNIFDHAESVTVSAEPIASFETGNPSRQQFGLLEFRGGLVLKCSHESFGGFSAVRVQPDGEHFLALSDRATWFRGRIVYKDGKPIGIADAALAPVLDADGKPAPQWDTESIAEDNGTLYVGLERIHTIVRFDFAKDGVLARGRQIAVPPELKDLPFNQSLESLVYVPKEYQLGGTLIAISELGLTEAGDIKAFLIGGTTPGQFAVKRTDGYAISDAAMLPNGDILILERQYFPDRGVSMRIRRIRLADIKPGALVDGPIIIEADKNYQIDNMEALSVIRTRSGETLLTILSDDNQSPTQRTVLLQFVMRDK
jgi:hypothetical protein